MIPKCFYVEGTMETPEEMKPSYMTLGLTTFNIRHKCSRQEHLRVYIFWKISYIFFAGLIRKSCVLVNSMIWEVGYKGSLGSILVKSHMLKELKASQWQAYMTRCISQDWVATRSSPIPPTLDSTYFPFGSTQGTLNIIKCSVDKTVYG